jgi:hypothetical protein
VPEPYYRIINLEVTPMSGKPNIEQVRKLREALATAEKERKAISEAQSTIRHQELCVSCAEGRLRTAEREASELLRAMDCEPGSGNPGHAARMSALLTMLAEDAERYGRTDR